MNQKITIADVTSLHFAINVLIASLEQVQNLTNRTKIQRHIRRLEKLVAINMQIAAQGVLDFIM